MYVIRKFHKLIIFALLFFSAACSISTGNKVDSNFGIPQLYLPDHWQVRRPDCSDSIFAIKYHGPDTINQKYIENIVVFKSSSTKSLNELATNYTDGVKHQLDSVKFSNVQSFKSKNSAGIVFDYTYVLQNMHLQTSVFVGRIANQKYAYTISCSGFKDSVGHTNLINKHLMSFLSQSFN